MSHLADCNFRPRLIEMFDRPPMLGYKRERVQMLRLKDERIEIQGKWANIRSIVQGLLNDGWKVMGEATGEPSGFKFTEVTLER